MACQVVRGLRWAAFPSLLVGLCALAVPAVAAPPRVINAVPDNGDTQVDPGVRELRVTFDQDMAPGGYSWCGGGPRFPRIRGKPHWESARVCVLPVELDPDHDYQLSINCPAAKNFRSVDGVPAVAYPIAFRTARGGASGVTSRRTVDRATQVASANRLWRLVDREYSYRDERAVDWRTLFREHAPRLEAARTPAEFARIAGELLAHAEDMHIWLESDGMTFASHVRHAPPNCDPALLPELVPNWSEPSDCVSWGRFPDRIGYLRIRSWGRVCEASITAAYEALWELSDCRALVIDVRENSGGSELLAMEVAGCFIDESMLYARHVVRDADAPGGFSDVSDRVVEPNKVRPKYRGRLAVLTGPHVMSSCEAFLLMMKQVPRCVLVGERSFGSSGNPQPHKLPNGVTVYVPSWRALTANGKPFEGIGIAPDVVVKSVRSDFEERDPVLERALEILRK